MSLSRGGCRRSY